MAEGEHISGVELPREMMDRLKTAKEKAVGAYNAQAVPSAGLVSLSFTVSFLCQREDGVIQKFCTEDFANSFT